MYMTHYQRLTRRFNESSCINNFFSVTGRGFNISLLRTLTECKVLFNRRLKLYWTRSKSSLWEQKDLDILS